VSLPHVSCVTCSSHLAGPRSGGDRWYAARPMSETPDQQASNNARDMLERELYWAEDATQRANLSTKELRVALHEFAAALKADQRTIIPWNEPQLGSTKRWRRRMKGGIYYLLRPVTRRYDRLLLDLASLARLLADRLAEAEGELDRLRQIVERPEASEQEIG